MKVTYGKWNKLEPTSVLNTDISKPVKPTLKNCMKLIAGFVKEARLQLDLGKGLYA